MSDTPNTTDYPLPAVETAHADPGIVAFFEALYEAKNSGSPDRFASWFSSDLLTYTDAALGWECTGHAAFKAGLEQFMPHWGGGRAYPTRIVGGPDSAVVAFTDTPELFGDEIHGLGAVDLRDGTVVRWIDYWDTTAFDREAFDRMAVPDEAYPADFHADALKGNATGAIRDVVARLHEALGRGDGEAAAALFAFSAIFEDMALRTLITGRSAIARYVGRMADAPYAAGSEVRHVLGGPTGGGYEWIASPSSNVRAGVTAIELDAQGLISRLTTLYDARRLAEDSRRDLIMRGQDFVPQHR